MAMTVQFNATSFDIYIYRKIGGVIQHKDLIRKCKNSPVQVTLSDAERAADMCTITNTLQAEDMGRRLKTRRLQKIQ